MTVYTFFKTFLNRESPLQEKTRYEVRGDRESADGRKYSVSHESHPEKVNTGFLEDLTRRVVEDHVEHPWSAPDDYGFGISFDPPYHTKIVGEPWGNGVCRSRASALSEIERRTVLETSSRELARQVDEVEEEILERVGEMTGDEPDLDIDKIHKTS